MNVFYVAAIIVGGKAGATFWYYVTGQGFTPTTLDNATLFDTISLNTAINDIALEGGGRCFVIPVSTAG